MINRFEYNDQDLQAIAFIGDALSPFFLEDPKNGSAAASYAAFAALDASQAAGEWPFGEEATVREGIAKMVCGLANGVDEKIIWEYRRLFVGPGAKAAAPWGSVYMDRDGVVFGASERDLRDWMKAKGIRRFSSDSEPSDHIGLLLAMTAWVCRHRPELLAEFLGLHVLTWSSHYLELLEQRSEHEFFGGLAMLTRTSLEGIQAQLAIRVEYPRFYR